MVTAAVNNSDRDTHPVPIVGLNSTGGFFTGAAAQLVAHTSPFVLLGAVLFARCPRRRVSTCSGESVSREKVQCRETAITGAGRTGGARPRAKKANKDLTNSVESTVVAVSPDCQSKEVCMETVAMLPGNVPCEEVWEVPLAPRADGGPPTLTEKTLMLVTKKLREIKSIEARIRAGETIEQNQQKKAERRCELIEEWIRLRSDVSLERGEDRGLGNADWSAEGLQEGADSRSSSNSPPAMEQNCPSQSRRAKRRQARKNAENRSEKKADGGGWTIVGKSKDKQKKQVTEEERDERRKAIQMRVASRIQTEHCEAYKLTQSSLRNLPLFSPDECNQLEVLVDQVVVDAERGLFKERTVDLTPMRNKYFFGFAYTYGAQKEHPGAHGIEAVWPPEETSPIPAWIQEKIITRLEERGIVKKGWINSATINDYAAGGCIVSHIDPPHLFDRPIISVSLFSECNLVFGTTFSFPREAHKDIEASTPIYVQPCLRGHSTVLKGYSADKITHAIRPCDLPDRRASVILRRVLPTAPVLGDGQTMPLEKWLKKHPN